MFFKGRTVMSVKLCEGNGPFFKVPAFSLKNKSLVEQFGSFLSWKQARRTAEMMAQQHIQRKV